MIVNKDVDRCGVILEGNTSAITEAVKTLITYFLSLLKREADGERSGSREEEFVVLKSMKRSTCFSLIRGFRKILQNASLEMKSNS